MAEATESWKTINDKTFTLHGDQLTFDYAAINDFVLLPAHIEKEAFADPTQYRIDELGEAMGAAVAPRQLDGDIDHGVRRHGEAYELSGARKQDRPQPAFVGRQRLFQKRVQHVLELTLPAQDGGGDQAG